MEKEQTHIIPEYQEFQEQLEVFEYDLANSLAEIDPDEEDKETPWFGERFKEWLERVDIALRAPRSDMIPLPIFFFVSEAWKTINKDKKKELDKQEVCNKCQEMYNMYYGFNFRGIASDLNVCGDFFDLISNYRYIQEYILLNILVKKCWNDNDVYSIVDVLFEIKSIENIDRKLFEKYWMSDLLDCVWKENSFDLYVSYFIKNDDFDIENDINSWNDDFTRKLDENWKFTFSSIYWKLSISEINLFLDFLEADEIEGWYGPWEYYCNYFLNTKNYSATEEELQQYADMIDDQYVQTYCQVSDIFLWNENIEQVIDNYCNWNVVGDTDNPENIDENIERSNLNSCYISSITWDRSSYVNFDNCLNCSDWIGVKKYINDNVNFTSDWIYVSKFLFDDWTVKSINLIIENDQVIN